MVRKPQRLSFKIMEMPAYLNFKTKNCKTCDSHFTAKSDIVDDYCFISKNKTCSFKSTRMPLSKSIAKSCLISSMTVSRVMIIKRRSDVGQSSFDALPEHLMMDEFKSVKM